MRTALVTGASRGLGYELCRQLLGDGWTVAALSRTEGENLSKLLSTSPDRLRWFACDVRTDAAELPVRDAIAFLGSLDLLINNAGMPGQSIGLQQTTADEVGELFNTHTLGCLRVTRAALQALRAAPGAHIVNISSRLGSISRTASGEFGHREFSYSYRISKAALNMLSACMAEELGPQGIRVSALHPGQFTSESSAAGARLSAREAAERIIRWLLTRDGAPLAYVESGGTTLPW